MKNPLRTLALSILIALAALPWIFPIPQPALAACTFLCNDGAGNGEFGANLQVDGNLTVLGTMSGGVYQTSGLRITGTTAIVPNSSEGTLYASVTGGGMFRGSGSTYDLSFVNQAGNAASGVIANTTNTAFFGNINIGAAGSAPISSAAIRGQFSANTTGTNPKVIELAGPIPSTATAGARFLSIGGTTEAAAFTSANVIGMQVNNTPTGGGGAVITNLRGIQINDQLGGSTLNIGIDSQVTAGSGKYGFYASGTATNYFNGPLQIVGTTTLAPASSQGAIYASTTGGGVYRGSGSTYDVSLVNQAGNTALGVNANTLMVSLGATAFANLGTPANGTFAYCNDCTIASPCAGGGNGALAKRLNGAWVCN